MSSTPALRDRASRSPAARGTRAGLARILVAMAAILALGACTSGLATTGSTAPDAGSSVPGASSPGGTVHLYTSVTQDTVDAVLAAYRQAHPDVTVDVFRAPTGELDARIASEERSGGIAADVLWGTDPLSVEAYASRDLFRAWTPANAKAVPAAYRTDTFWGTRILDMVIVYNADLETPPTDWSDLRAPAFADSVAIPDPAFAGSALGALGYFASADGYGMDYYRALKANGATQVQAIAEVVTDVAQGQFSAGITLAKVARDAAAKGSPVKIAWPSSGAIAIYSPIAVFREAPNPSPAESFVDFVLGPEAQAAIAGTGWQPVRSGVSGGPEIGGSQVAPDWKALFDRQEALLTEYRTIFGG